MTKKYYVLEIKEWNGETDSQTEHDSYEDALHSINESVRVGNYEGKVKLNESYSYVILVIDGENEEYIDVVTISYSGTGYTFEENN